MAVAHALLGAFLPFVAEQEDEPGWWEALLLGVQDFFTVERVRDTVIIVIAAGLYYWLARHAKDRMILTPMRIVVAQELQSYVRLGVRDEALTSSITALEQSTSNPQEQEKRILTGMGLRRDFAKRARLKELEQLPDAALISTAVAAKDSLHQPVLKYLEGESLTGEQARALRHVMAAITEEKARTTWVECRTAMRRIRKSQSLGVGGLGLMVLLVILFGNPAILAFGVLGAVVSRLVAFFRDSTDTDQKYNWVVLFLVPIVGGLSAYGGVLLIDAMRTWELLGETFSDVEFGGESANVPTMAAAFLFGFVERLLDNVSGKAVDGMGAVAAKELEDTASPKASTTTTTVEIQRSPDAAATATSAPTAPAPSPPRRVGGGARRGYLPRKFRLLP